MRDLAEPANWRRAIDARLAERSAGYGGASPALGRAMSEAVLAPGKRSRALVLLISGEASGGVRPPQIDAACAIELVHTASLIFDDLPCTDNAAARRGRPTSQLAHGECRAILAGIALVTEAFRLLASARDADVATRARLVDILATALGPAGLSAEMIGLIQRLPAARMAPLAALGRTLGRAFQFYDDLLDVRAEGAALGKDTGRDAIGPGPARGVLAVRSLAQAEVHYEALRAELDALLRECGFDSRSLAAHIAQVLPAPATRAA